MFKDEATISASQVTKSAMAKRTSNITRPIWIYPTATLESESSTILHIQLLSSKFNMQKTLHQKVV